jgi:hypothetical protein
MRSTRFWAAVGFVTATALTLAVIAGLTASSSTAPHGFRFAKAAQESMHDKAGIANEGPNATLAAQEEAARAYPADSVPAVATENSIATF